MQFRLSWPTFVLAMTYAFSSPGGAWAFEPYRRPTSAAQDEQTFRYPIICPDRNWPCHPPRFFYKSEWALDKRDAMREHLHSIQQIESHWSFTHANIIEALDKERDVISAIKDDLSKAESGIMKRDKSVLGLMRLTQTDLARPHRQYVIVPDDVSGLSLNYLDVKKTPAEVMCGFYTGIGQMQSDYLDLVIAVNEGMSDLHSRMDATQFRILVEVLHMSNLPLLDKIADLPGTWTASKGLGALERNSKNRADRISGFQNIYQEYIKMEDATLQLIHNSKAIACLNRPQAHSDGANIPAKEHSEVDTAHLVELTWEVGREIRKAALHNFPEFHDVLLSDY
jgi:hypothetical protein